MLLSAYDDIRGVAGFEVEKPAVIQLAEGHRNFWRPATPRLILLAESHVYTTEAESATVIRMPANAPPGLPPGFVRLVYCLGYGESGLLGGIAPEERKGGTPQFWQVLYSCLHPVACNADFAEVQLSRTRDLERRIENKLRLLGELRARGIWLVDASIAALYRQNRPKPALRVREEVLHRSWDGHIESVLQEASPEAVLCVGLGVAQTLASRLNRLGIPWGAVPQPQARLATTDRFEIFATYRTVSTRPRSVAEMRRRWLRPRG